jgi:hypothetical protein
VQCRLAVSDGDDEAVPDEEEDLTELDDCLRFKVARRLQDEEERVAVHLELRALVGLDRILDRKLVELELPANGVELVLRRLVQSDPDECADLPGRLYRVLERQAFGTSPPGLVNGAVDDHGADYRAYLGRRRPSRRGSAATNAVAAPGARPASSAASFASSARLISEPPT